MFRVQKLLLASGILSTLVCGALGQQPSDLSARSILVGALDANQNPVRNLNKESFRVRINGKAATVTSAAYSVAPRRIVVLLDMSGSMVGSEKSKKWQIARDALQDVIDQTPAAVDLALISFSNKVQTIIDFSGGRASMAEWLKGNAVEQSEVRGHTAVRDAILAGVKMLQPARPGDSIYAITDGADNASHTSLSETKRALSESGVRLFAFWLMDEFYFSSAEGRYGSDEFLQMTRDSGGFVFGVRNAGLARTVNEADRGKIKSESRALIELVNGLYTVQIETPQLHKDAKVKLEIVDGAGAVRKDVTSIYPSLLTR